MSELIEYMLLKAPRGLTSRVRVAFYRLLGLKAGRRNRFEAIRCRRPAQIEMGDTNALTAGCWLWPEDAPHDGIRIRIGSGNYFNRDVMIDSCGLIEIGDDNLFGPGIYITDSDHSFGAGVSPKMAPMNRGRVKIGNRCWVGARAVVLQGVELGDECVVGAGAVVTRSFPAGSVIAGVPARLIQRGERG